MKTRISPLFIGLLGMSAALGQPNLFRQPIRISVNNSEMKPFEPIYLKMELLGALDCQGCTFGNLESIDLKLQVTDGTGSYPYIPPIKACRITPLEGPVDSTAYSTVILSHGKIITEHPGKLELVLLDPSGYEVSNRLDLHVTGNLSPRESRLLEDLTPASKGEYGMFVYLEGGEHLIHGFEIAKKMAASETDYSEWMKPVLANNYAQVVYDWPNRKEKRGVDLEKVEAYFPSKESKASENIRLAVVQTLISAKKMKDLPASLKTKVGEEIDLFKGNKSQAFRAINERK